VTEPVAWYREDLSRFVWRTCEAATERGYKCFTPSEKYPIPFHDAKALYSAVSAPRLTDKQIASIALECELDSPGDWLRFARAVEAALIEKQ
jgi:hypothetical protein